MASAGADDPPSNTTHKHANEEERADDSAVVNPSHAGVTAVPAGVSSDRCFLQTYSFGSASGARLAVSSLERRCASASSAALGSFVWPSALMLAAYLEQHMREAIRGATVLELGAGRSVSGLLAAQLGAAQVILTDADPAALADAELTVRLNGLSRAQVQVHSLAWGEFHAGTAALVGRVSLLLGADVLYDARDFEQLLATVAYFGVPLLTVYQHRGEGLRRSVRRCSSGRLRAGQRAVASGRAYTVCACVASVTSAAGCVSWLASGA